MTHTLIINQVKALEWNLSLKESVVMSKMVDLSTWATAVYHEKKVYYVLYRSKLWEEIPLLGKNEKSAGFVLQYLEEKGLIESINKFTTPAFRITDKGREWTSTKVSTALIDKENKKTNGGENKRFTFRLEEELEYDDLEDKYKRFLEHWCKEYALKYKVSEDEFEGFVSQKKSIGKAHKDWSAGFESWCFNLKKLNKKRRLDK